MRNQHCLQKKGVWTVCRFKKGLGKKEGVVFLRGGLETPIHTMMTKVLHQFSLKCPLNYFVQKFVDKILQNQWTATVLTFYLVLLYWCYMCDLYNFIFQRLIWKVIGMHFLWFEHLELFLFTFHFFNFFIWE